MLFIFVQQNWKACEATSWNFLEIVVIKVRNAVCWKKSICFLSGGRPNNLPVDKNNQRRHMTPFIETSIFANREIRLKKREVTLFEAGTSQSLFISTAAAIIAPNMKHFSHDFKCLAGSWAKYFPCEGKEWEEREPRKHHAAHEIMVAEKYREDDQRNQREICLPFCQWVTEWESLLLKGWGKRWPAYRE